MPQKPASERHAPRTVAGNSAQWYQYIHVVGIELKLTSWRTGPLCNSPQSRFFASLPRKLYPEVQEPRAVGTRLLPEH